MGLLRRCWGESSLAVCDGVCMCKRYVWSVCWSQRRELEETVLTRSHVGDGNFHAALIFDKRIPGEFEKVDEAAHRVCLLLFWSFWI